MDSIQLKSIKKIYVLHHTHTDIGYTDFQDGVFSYLKEVIGQAVNLCEQTEDYPEFAKMRWTCEVAYITNEYLKQVSDNEVEKFLKYYKENRIGVAGLPLHWTPLLSPSVAIRSMKSVARMKKDYGITINSAMQCDVNGLAWYWLDILHSIGIENFLIAPNPDRGISANTDATQRYFWWNSPSQKKILTLHGYHYSVGILQWYLTMDLKASQKRIQSYLSALENRGDYPFDFVMVPATETSSCDNGGPMKELCDYIIKWNKAHPELPMELITLPKFFEVVRNMLQTKSLILPEYTGDWSDPWVDGVGSTARETSWARAAERLVPITELLSAFSESQDEYYIDAAAENIAFYDEHTWGACCSIQLPDSPFTEMQKQYKLSFARKGFGQIHEEFARLSRRFAKQETNSIVENDLKFAHGFGAQQGLENIPQASRKAKDDVFFVFNPTGYHKNIAWEYYIDISGVRPFYLSHSMLTDSYYPGLNINVDFPTELEPNHIIKASLPPYSYQIITPSKVDYSQGYFGENYIENQYYKVEFDVKTGGISSLYDKELNREIVDQKSCYTFGEVLYEIVNSPKGRSAIFNAPDWTDIRNIGYQHTEGHTPYEHYCADRVRLSSPYRTSLGVEIRGTLIFEKKMTISILYRLPFYQKALYVEISVNKEEVREPESVHIVFPFNIADPRYYLDNGDQTINPITDKIPYSCQGWTSCHHFVGASGKDFALNIVPLDTPLAMFQGLTHRTPLSSEKYNDSLIGFWGMNNHWHTNFAASQTGICPMRYWITTSPTWNEHKVREFAFNNATPPIISRLYHTDGKQTDITTLIDIKSAIEIGSSIRRDIDLSPKVSILRLVEHSQRGGLVDILWKSPLVKVEICTALGENTGQILSIKDTSFSVELKAQEVVYIKVTET